MAANFQPVIQARANNISSTSHVPEQPTNASGDLLILWIGHVRGAGPATVTTPAGWTLHPTFPVTQDDTRVYKFYKESTGGETFPTLTTSIAVESTMLSAVFPDADFVSGPFGDTVLDVSTGNDAFQAVTTVADNSYVAYFMTMHRRNAGWNAGNSTVNMEFVASAQSGTSTNADTFSQAALDYAIASGSTLTPPRPSQGEDNVKWSFEVRTNGLIVPTLLSDEVRGSTLPGFTQGADDAFRDAIMRSGWTQDGPIQNYPFDASADVNTGTNEITITAHGFDEAWVVQADANGATLPTGLTDGAYYWVRPVDADTIQLVDCEGDIDSDAEFYVSGGSFKAAVGLTATGSGTCRLRDCGWVFSANGDGTARWPVGSESNPDDFSGNWNGNSCGSQTNRIGFARDFATPVDLSTGFTGFTFRYGTSNFDFGERGIMFIDVNDEWYSVQTTNSTFSNASFNHYIDVGGDHSSSAFYRESGGTFDATQVKYIVSFYSDIDTNRANGSQTLGDPFSVNDLVVFGGTPALPLSFRSIAETIAEKLDARFAEAPSGDQTVFRFPFSIGGPSQPVYMDENAVSVSVPSLGNGLDEVQYYIRDWRIDFAPQAGDTLRMRSSILADSNGYVVERHSIPATGTYSYDSRLFVNTSPELDADVAYDRLNFVGCPTITDNNAQIRNSSFDVAEVVAADTGLIALGASTDIADSVFTANTDLTTGHAIRIATPGTYDFTNLTFSGFGADGTVTAAVFNDSGGAVTINVSGGTAPTVRNGTGASTTVNAGVTVTLTGVVQDSRVFATTVVSGVDTTTLANVVAGVSGTVAFSASSGDDIRVSIRKASAAPFYQTFSIGSRSSPVTITADSTFPVSQILDQ